MPNVGYPSFLRGGYLSVVGTVFANGPRGLASIPGRVIPKTLKMVDTKKKKGVTSMKSHNQWKTIKLQTGVSSSLTEYPSGLVLSVFSDESNKLETYTYVRTK